MSKYGLLAIVLFFSLESCRKQNTFRPDSSNPVSGAVTTQSSSPAPVKAGSDSAAAATADPKASVKDIDFRYLTTRSKISFKNQDQEINNTTTNFRVAKDSLIWLSISGIGVEVARALVTQDSVVVMDRIHRNYSVYSYDALSQQFNFRLTFQLIQSLLIGNLPFPQQPAQRLSADNSQVLLRQQIGNALVDNFIGAENRKLKKLQVAEQATQNTLTLEYDDFNALNNFLFPYKGSVNIHAKSGKDGQFHQTVLQIQHTKVEITEKDPGFPFSIPDRYERK